MCIYRESRVADVLVTPGGIKKIEANIGDSEAKKSPTFLCLPIVDGRTLWGDIRKNFDVGMFVSQQACADEWVSEYSSITMTHTQAKTYAHFKIASPCAGKLISTQARPLLSTMSY